MKGIDRHAGRPGGLRPLRARRRGNKKTGDERRSEKTEEAKGTISEDSQDTRGEDG
jgi:hypothetical protein